MPSTVLAVATPQGPARCFVDPADDSTALLVLGHGAGGGVHAADLELLARRLPVLGITVVRFEQPWRTAGRRLAGPPATLDEAWQAEQWGEDALAAQALAARRRDFEAAYRFLTLL